MISVIISAIVAAASWLQEQEANIFPITYRASSTNYHSNREITNDNYHPEFINGRKCILAWIPITKYQKPSSYVSIPGGVIEYHHGQLGEADLNESDYKFYIISNETVCGKNVDPGIAKGEKVYWRGQEINGADSQSFYPISNRDGSYSGYFSDKNAIYGNAADKTQNGTLTGGYQFTKLRNLSPSDVIN